MNHREITVWLEGKVVPRNLQLLTASIVLAANKIAHARLVYQDGDAATGKFEVLDTGIFEHGKKLEIKADDSPRDLPLFAGIIVTQQIKLRENKSSILIITCKHPAVTMSLAKKGRYFEDLTDKDLLEALFSEHSINAQVEAIENIKHKQLVQFESTDWEFCLNRAQAAGLVIYTKGEKICITPPTLDSDAVLDLTFGATLLSADIKSDARTQTSGLEAMRWDASNQDVTQFSSQIQIEESPGTTSAGSLSEAMGEPEHVLRKPTQSDEETQRLVNATATLNAINRVSGTLKTLGVETIFPGDIVNLNGLSKAFNGKALVTGLRHEIDTVLGWRTYYQVGGLSLPQIPSTQNLAGLHIGIVVDLEDPENEFRVKIKLPMLDNNSDGIWARVASIDAGPDRGLFVRPEVNDEVIVGFVQSDMRSAMVLGMLHSSAHAPTEVQEADNHIKTWVTRSGLALRFDDEQVAVTLSSPAGNIIAISEDESGISLKDQNGNQYIMNDRGITLESASDLTISAAGDIEINAGANLVLSAASQLGAEGGTGASIESGAITVVKGALVQIN